MSKMAKLLFAFLFTACGGGGGSGVSGGTLLVELADGELAALCEYSVSLDEPRTITCDNGDMIEVESGTQAECIADIKESQMEFPNCDATVDDFEACVEALADRSDDDRCDENFPAACLALASDACN